MADDETPCSVCGNTKAEHEGFHHTWTDNPGDLNKKQSRSTPPMHRDAQAVAENHVTKLVLRLIERLSEKGLLDSRDMLHIFGGIDDRAAADGSTAGQAEAGRPAAESDRGSGADPLG